MNPVLPDDALEFGATARKAFEAIGGVDLARRIEEEPAHRDAIVGALHALGVDDLDPRDDADTLAAAAALCEAAGRVALSYPLVASLLRDRATDNLPFAVVPDDRLRVDHGDFFGEWRVSLLDGHACRATSKGGAFASRLGPFVSDLVGGDTIEDGASYDVSLSLTLTSWQILGTVDRAIELAVDHVNNRIQFGKPIAAFQSVQFQLADAAVAAAGLRELAQFTVFRLADAPTHARPDVLALRVHALDVARAVLRTCQQLHGAAGVCDEYDISVLARHIQPALRLPFGAERSAAELADAIALDGFVGLFAHGGSHT
ncbi:MAG: hypothetical protein QOF21_1584 [Actinomycetota bacterium]|jgi:hypothetical protein